MVHVTKNNASVTHFFALSPKPIARFRWKRARLSLFRPQTHLPSFIQIHPSFRDLLAKTTFQIVTIIGAPIGSPITRPGVYSSFVDRDQCVNHYYTTPPPLPSSQTTIIACCQHQIIQLGDRHTCLWTTCPGLLAEMFLQLLHNAPQSPQAFLQKLANLWRAELIHLPSLANWRQSSLSS